MQGLFDARSIQMAYFKAKFYKFGFLEKDVEFSEKCEFWPKSSFKLSVKINIHKFWNILAIQIDIYQTQ